MLNRRDFLAFSSGAALTTLGTPAFAFPDPPRKRLAVVTTSWRYRTHAWHMASSDGPRIYFQSANASAVNAVRVAAEKAQLLTIRISADAGPLLSIHLSENLADGVLVAKAAADQVTDAEVLRVLRPRGIAIIGDRKLVKPVPTGIDDWSHPYHGPDNNPQSNDQLVKGSFQTQFIADPKFSRCQSRRSSRAGGFSKRWGISLTKRIRMQC